MYIKLLSMHRKETDSNKRLASALVEKWSRPIFNSTVNFRAQDVQEVVPRFNAKELAAQAEEKVKSMGNASADVVPEQKRSGGVTKNGTIVPRPLGMDFHVQPANEVKATASDKCRKDLSPSPSPQPSRSPSPQPSRSPSPQPSPAPAPAPAPSPSTRYRKESIKGKLHDRFINNKKGKSVDSRHVTLSIEGRTLDRLN